jgi:NAD-dependent dihydropyrimidine dehydrogenase PreA subunit
MTVCGSGGEREVNFLHNALRLMELKLNQSAHTFSEFTIKRQCEPEFIELLTEKINHVDAVLSLGCGIGTQAIAERFENLPVLPGVNTSIIGMGTMQGVWLERCVACGECILDETAGICPVARCAKGILNGPCGGSKHGKCESNKEMDCAWIQIYKRLEKLGQLDKMRKYYPMRNFQTIPRPRRLIKSVTGGNTDGQLSL